MMFHSIFDQIPNSEPYLNDPSGKLQIRDYKTLLSALNLIIQHAPIFENIRGSRCEMPISYILAWPMGTQAGNTAFLNPKVNAQLQKILNNWDAFLLSSSSRSTLTDDKDGWFGEDAMSAMPSFDEDFTCDPDASYYGVSSWDDFLNAPVPRGRAASRVRE